MEQIQMTECLCDKFLNEKFWTKTWGILEDLLDEQKKLEAKGR